MRARALALRGMLCLLAPSQILGACRPAPAPAPAAAVADGATVAQGAALLVDDVPLRAEDMQTIVDDIRRLYPEYSLVHARRLALTNEFLPRAALRSSRGDAWNEARRACTEAADLDREIAWSGEGTWKDLGLGLWSAARGLPPGTWSGPIELVGRWVRLRLDELRPASDAADETLRVSLLEFAYMSPAALSNDVNQAVDGAHLTVLDPAWGEAVPESWKHRMRDVAPYRARTERGRDP